MLLLLKLKVQRQTWKSRNSYITTKRTKNEKILILALNIAI